MNKNVIIAFDFLTHVAHFEGAFQNVLSLGEGY